MVPQWQRHPECLLARHTRVMLRIHQRPLCVNISPCMLLMFPLSRLTKLMSGKESEKCADYIPGTESGAHTRQMSNRQTATLKWEVNFSLDCDCLRRKSMDFFNSATFCKLERLTGHTWIAAAAHKSSHNWKPAPTKNHRSPTNIFSQKISTFAAPWIHLDQSHPIPYKKL